MKPLTLWKAVQLFLDGKSCEEVGQELGLDPSVVEDAVRLARIAAQRDDDNF